ncbi:EAL domain-containing protein [Secundilactobacillus similis]|jgi:EAL domain-containing protein (putative c-di-GMP-specific phosphodiesterase class I)|nr:EAL domain-containing protein [Secundilactobacillus similis]
MTFYGQPKFAAQQPTDVPVGYELFIREYRGNQWVLPTNFGDISADEIERLLTKALRTMPESITILSFNLEQLQFIDPVYIDMVARVQATTSIRLFTELTERTDPRVTDSQLLAAAKRFHDYGLLVCMDDVGTGDNTPSLVFKLNDYIDEYKFAFQNFRPFAHISDIAPELNFWYDLSQENDKMLAIEGLESAHDLAVVQHDYPCDIVQGYYTGKPALLPNNADGAICES